jgi:hypothetical protein
MSDGVGYEMGRLFLILQNTWRHIPEESVLQEKTPVLVT